MNEQERAPIHSMTGFGHAAIERQGLRLAIELRSVNSRYLDIQVRCPADLQSFEQAIRERIQAQVSRGKISAHLAWAGEGQPRDPAPARRGGRQALSGPVAAAS